MWAKKGLFGFEEKVYTARKMSKYGDFSGLYFPVFGLNKGIYVPKKPPYLDTFYAMIMRGERIGISFIIEGGSIWRELIKQIKR